MQAFQLIEWQQPPVLRDVPVPEPGPGEVLTRTLFASLDPVNRAQILDAPECSLC